jgi:hypothetical protein
MTHDPIVEEIHRAREKIWKECGEDPKKFFKRLKAAEAKHMDRLVSSPKRAKALTPAH